MICFFENLAKVGRGTTKLLFVCAALLFFYSSAIYSKSLQNDFVWDSVGVVLEDPMIRELGNVPVFFTAPLVLGVTGEQADGLVVGAIRYYRPLVTTLHAVEFAVFGESPLAYKAVNVLLNGLVVVLGFLVVRNVSGSLVAAFLSALVYASVPARAEAVYWVYSDSYLLLALFALFTFLSYLKGRRGWAMFFFVVSLFFQEGGVMLPAALLAYEVTRSGLTKSLRERLVGIVPFGLIATGYLVVRHFIVGRVPTSSLDAWSLLKAVGYQCWEHSRIFLMTDASATVYLYEKGMFSPGGSAAVLGAVALLVVIVMAFLLWRFRRDELFWFLWFLVWINPTFNVGAYNDYLMAEKSLYLASLGLSTLVVGLLCSLERFQPVALFIVCAFFVFNSAQVYARADSWADTSTYMAKVLEFEPEFDLALVTAGSSAFTEGRYEDSANYYLRLLSLRPELVRSMGKPYAESVLRWAEKLAETGEVYQAIQILEGASRVVARNSEIHNGLGIVYYLAGDRERARKNWTTALRFDPSNLEASQNIKMLDVSR
jgi:hypothetical protein